MLLVGHEVPGCCREGELGWLTSYLRLSESTVEITDQVAVYSDRGSSHRGACRSDRSPRLGLTGSENQGKWNGEGGTVEDGSGLLYH